MPTFSLLPIETLQRPSPNLNPNPRQSSIHISTAESCFHGMKFCHQTLAPRVFLLLLPACLIGANFLPCPSNHHRLRSHGTVQMFSGSVIFPPSTIQCCIMAMKQKVQHYFYEVISSLMQLRHYNSKVDWSKVRPVVLEKIKNRTNNYTVRNVAPIAYDVLTARSVLTEGVSSLLEIFPIKSCKVCPEVYIGETGHQIKTCHGSKRIIKDQLHRWTNGNLNDLVPLEPYHCNKAFDHFRVPAIVELCHRAGAKITEGSKLGGCESNAPLPPKEVNQVAPRTLEAWETLRSGVESLLLVYPVMICKHCSQVHVGPDEYKASPYEVLNRSCRSLHRWKKAGVDDLVPQKLVWHRRPQDPPVLVDRGRCFYGRAPAVVALCVQAGARVPVKYSPMMKSLGLTST